MSTPDPVERAKLVKLRHENELLKRPNVVAVGVGFRQRGGQTTGEVCIVVSVRRKVPRDQLAPRDLIPAEFEGIPVDVHETGEIRALQ